MTRGAVAIRLLLLFAAMVLIIIVAPTMGSSSLSLSHVFDGSIPRDQNTDAVIFFNLRLPRVLYCAVAGAMLAVAGALTQSVLRNDLATPYTMGISSGAAVGALLALQFPALGGAAGAGVAALIGAFATMVLVLGLARSLSAWEGSSTLVLIGVTINILLGSVILVIQYMADPFQTFLMIRWMMGAVDVTNYMQPGILAGVLLAVLVISTAMSRGLDALQLGDLAAHSLGVVPGRTRLIALALAALGTALIVSISGPIGFVGLLVPHAMRRLVGRGHGVLIAASAMAGAGFLVASDTLARMVGGDLEVPVGIVTALLGGPVFLVILLGNERRRSAGASA